MWETNKQKQNNHRALKDTKQVRLKLMVDMFLGPYSKLGVPAMAEQKTKKDVLRWRMGVRTRENSGPGSQCVDRGLADRVHYSSVTD